MCLSIIVAMDKNQLIGKNNALPWHLPADLAYFKRVTTGKTVLMGRKTYDSIGKPLSNRRNIVLSRKPQNDSNNREVANSIGKALYMCKNEEEVMIIGGMSVYQQFLTPPKNENDLFGAEDIHLIDRLYITEVGGEFVGDAYFPKFNRHDFIEISRESYQPDEKNIYAYNFTILQRR